MATSLRPQPKMEPALREARAAGLDLTHRPRRNPYTDPDRCATGNGSACRGAEPDNLVCRACRAIKKAEVPEIGLSPMSRSIPIRATAMTA
jgi:hypothetical protein